MSEYNYYDAVYQSIEEYIINNVSTVEYSSPEELEEHIIGDLLSNDEITGAASGSYTCNTYNAEEFLCHNWQLLQEWLITSEPKKTQLPKVQNIVMC